MNRCVRDPFDLTDAFAMLRAFAPADDGTGPSPAAEPGAVVPPDDAAGEGDEDDTEPEELTDDEVKVPRIKQLSDEAAKWRRKFRQTQERMKALEDGQASEELKAENRSLRLELAWAKATGTVAFRDPAAGDAAWKLAADDLTKVAIGDDGTVDLNRVGEIVNHVIRTYPYLVDQEPAPAPPRDAFPADRPSGPRTNGKAKVNQSALDLATLQRKFPALRSR